METNKNSTVEPTLAPTSVPDPVDPIDVDTYRQLAAALPAALDDSSVPD